MADFEGVVMARKGAIAKMEHMTLFSGMLRVNKGSTLDLRQENTMSNENIPIETKTKGKKIRVVFSNGRDLNIFNVQDFNIDGQWWRITDDKERMYVIDPAKVNYTEQK